MERGWPVPIGERRHVSPDGTCISRRKEARLATACIQKRLFELGWTIGGEGRKNCAKGEKSTINRLSKKVGRDLRTRQGKKGKRTFSRRVGNLGALGVTQRGKKKREEARGRKKTYVPFGRRFDLLWEKEGGVYCFVRRRRLPSPLGHPR